MALSQLEKNEALKIFFLGKQPYRCLQCYHRTWLKKTNAKGRTLSLLIVVLACLVMALSVYKFFLEQPLMPSVSIIAPSTKAGSQEGIQDDEQTSPSLASLINMPDQNSSNDAGANNSPNGIEYSNRQATELSPEQQASLLLQAKQQAEAAEELSQARVEQLESVLLPVGDELESLVKVEVGYIVERWREAWATGNIDDYLIAYGTDFVPANDLDIASWKQQRRARVTPQKQIDLSLSEFDIKMDENLDQSTINFNQRYQSGSYIETSRKRLTLEKEDGTWKIVSEAEIK